MHAFCGFIGNSTGNALLNFLFVSGFFFSFFNVLFSTDRQTHAHAQLLVQFVGYPYSVVLGQQTAPPGPGSL